MCPICIISAVVLGASAASAGGINWLAARLRARCEDVPGVDGRLMLQSDPVAPVLQPEKTPGPATGKAA